MPMLLLKPLNNCTKKNLKGQVQSKEFRLKSQSRPLNLRNPAQSREFSLKRTSQARAKILVQSREFSLQIRNIVTKSSSAAKTTRAIRSRWKWNTTWTTRGSLMMTVHYTSLVAAMEIIPNERSSLKTTNHPFISEMIYSNIVAKRRRRKLL